MGMSKKILVAFYMMVVTFIFTDLRKEADEKIKKAEKAKNPIEIFKTSLWLYRRGFYNDFAKLFKKAIEVDIEVNKDKRKLPEILGYVKYEVEENETIENEDEEEFEEHAPSAQKKQPSKSPQAKSTKKTIYDSVIKKLRYLKSKLKQEETIFEEQIIKKDIARQKIQQEKDKVGWNFTNKLVSPHFILYTDVDLDDTISILDNLEAFFNTFYFFFYDTIDFSKFKNRITVNVLSNKKTYTDIINKRYDVTKDNRPIDLYFHLRRNDSSLFDIKNNVVLATIEITQSVDIKGEKKQTATVDFILALPDIYKAVFENLLYLYIFKSDKKYAELGQCFWTGMRTYFSYLIPHEIAFHIGSYLGGEPFMDINLTKEAISNKEIPDLKTLLTNNNFEDPMRQFKKYDPSTFIRIYTTQCYAIFYYLLHRTNPNDFDRIIQQLANKDNYNYTFFSRYIKSDEELYKFIENDLKKELEKYTSK